MRRALALTTIAVVAAAGGCVQQDRHDQALLTLRAKEEQIVQLQEENANLGAVRDQARARIESLEAQVSRLETAFDSQAQRSDEWLRRVSQIGPLPLELEVALEEVAADYPELLTFDGSTGSLRFAGDFTFDLGSVELKPEAASTIATLAGILNAPPASTFELHLIGHTDNVPIQRHDTKQRHPTNVHLSVHRAIAVRDALADAGVSPERMLVAGYGEHRPIVPNGAKGAAENRRVELRLVPTAQASTQQTAEPELLLPEEPLK